MRILYVAQNFATPDDPSGLRHYAHAEFLSKHGHEVVVLTADRLQKAGAELSHARAPEAMMRGVRVLRVRVPMLRQGLRGRLSVYFAFMVAAMRAGLWEKGRFDIVFVSSPPLPSAISGVVLATLKRARFVLEIRDLWPQSAIVLGFLKSPVMIWLSRMLERWLYRRAKRIICVTEGIADSVRSYSRLSRKVHVVRNGVDTELFDAVSSTNCQAMRELSPERFIALYAGGHGVNNALDVLVDAAWELRNEPVHLVLLGEGSQTACLKLRCQELGLENVDFPGALPRKEVPQWIMCADALLWPVFLTSGRSDLTHLKRGAVPNKLYDYLAAGKPVVTSVPPDGEAAEILRKYGCPYFVAPDGRGFADSLRKLAGERSRMASREVDLASFRSEWSREGQAAVLMKILMDLTFTGQKRSRSG